MVSVDTSVNSSKFRLRRVGGVLVVESLVQQLDAHEALLKVINEAMSKTGDGLIIHLPTPNYITSLFIHSILDAADACKEAGRPFLAVVHPKLKLLIQMFNLQDHIPCADRLDSAITKIHSMKEKK